MERAGGGEEEVLEGDWGLVKYASPRCDLFVKGGHCGVHTNEYNHNRIVFLPLRGQFRK